MENLIEEAPFDNPTDPWLRGQAQGPPPGYPKLYRYVLHYQHKTSWTIYGNVDYGTEDQLDRLQKRAAELALQNPHLKYWVDKAF